MTKPCSQVARRLWVACTALTLVACGSAAPSTPPSERDAGQLKDASPWHPPEAGQGHDSGTVQPAADGGSEHDAGRAKDAGSPREDGGFARDSGSLQDAGPKLPAWTVLVYMAADNNLEKYAIDDLNEMLAATISDDVQLIVQIDRASGFYELGVGGLASWESMKRFRVREKQLEDRGDLGEQNTGEPSVLSDFIQWGFSEYPSERRMLVLWDHGNAWQGYGGDDSAGEDRLDQSELQGAIGVGLSAQGEKLDVIGFDACLMSTFVSGLALRERAHYFIGSEELEPGSGWDYTDFLSFLSAHADGPAVDVGTAIVEGFYAQSRAERKHNDVTISVLDLQKYEPVRIAYDDLVSKLQTETDEQKTNIAKARDAVVEYGKHSDPSHAYNMIDLGDFSRKLAALDTSFVPQRDALLSSLSDLVVASRYGRTKASSTGTSIYFPTASAFYENGYDAIQEGLEWRTFLKALYTLADNPAVAAPSFLGQTASDEGTISEGETGAVLTAQPVSAAPECNLAKGPEASSALKPSDIQNVASATLINGLIDSRTGDVHVFSRESAQLDPGTGEVKGAWDRHVLVANQGATQVILFAEFEQTDEPRFVYANVPVLYSPAPTCACAVPGTPGYSDVDSDGVADCADGDVDADGVPDKGPGVLDNCTWVPNADQTDTDVDGVGDVCSSNAHEPPLGCQPEPAGDYGHLMSAFWHVTIDRVNDERFGSTLYVATSAGTSEISPQPGALLWPRGLILRQSGNLGFQTGSPLPFNLQKPIDFRYADIEQLYVLNEAGDPLLDAQLQPTSLLEQLGWNDVYMRVFVSDFAHRGGAAEVRGDFSSCDPPPLEVCAAPLLPDCDARCIDSSALLQNGSCDDGSNGTPNLNCELRNFDDGECQRPDCPGGYLRDCQGKCTLQEAALGDGHCDELAQCESLQYDRGDCPCGPNCSGHGTCEADGCDCESGYGGDYCEVPPSCGDGSCQLSDRETCQTCAADCGACPMLCGDGTCSAKDGESCQTCGADCGACACGDGKCSLDTESCSTCPGDCGACPLCGDFVCQGHETKSPFTENQAENCGSCPTDCGSCQGDCCVASPPSAAGAGGCADPAISACACALSPKCCTEGWSLECITLAATSCNLVCAACPPVTGGDQDTDSICGTSDNCPLVANADQADTDQDGVGDVCDICQGGDDRRDPDRDGTPTHCDNCPLLANVTQADGDSDGVGDDCDVCRTVANAQQQDPDGDRVGSACDNCQAVSNPDQKDTDADGLGDACDACTDSASSPDTDSDGMQDHCDADDDNDAITDLSDNCPLHANVGQLNSDADANGGDACDPDDDNDGVLDLSDNCPLLVNVDQLNADLAADGGDACDLDDDNDGSPDTADNCPLLTNVNQLNTDLAADGGDACDPDDDNDGVLDSSDNCPVLANASQLDVDQDDVGDICDPGVPAHCSAIHVLDAGAPSGRYVIDPDGEAGSDAPFEAECDMTTDGGGWTLVLNYMRQLDTQPTLSVRTQNLPLLSTAAFGSDESGSPAWGHAGNARLASLDGNELRFYARSSAHLRTIHFATIDSDCLAYAESGTGSCAGVPALHRTLAGHDADLPASATDFGGDGGDEALTALPFYDQVGHQWAIGEAGTRWSVDDADIPADTLHRVWVRSSPDLDRDGAPNDDDNCPYLANSNQLNTDAADGGDACDLDDDNDGELDSADNCPLLVNTDQADNDVDASGDVCDPDDDNDGDLDTADNCPTVFNADQANLDNDLAGDSCDADDDDDGLADDEDNCPRVSNADQLNTDLEVDGGDACDADDDDDAVDDMLDNCPLLANSDQIDVDTDSIGDACDPSLPPTCVGVTCSNHGTCSTGTGSVVCTCTSGWSGADCATPDCAEMDCSGRGGCQINGGIAACACNAGFGGPSCDYTLVYALDIPVTARWNTAADVPYSVDNSAVAGLFDRVGYLLQLDSQTVWVDAQAFTIERSKLGVPTDWIWDRALSDMTVRSNVPGVSDVTSATGSMELWSGCYNQGANGVYDWDDEPTGSDCYGSLQLHQGMQTVLAVNTWSGNQATVSLGIGNQPTNNPDWTFAGNAAQFQTRRLEVYVREPLDCSGAPCAAHGMCDANGGNVTCQCDAGWGGAACERCDFAAGYGDLDSDGTCEQACPQGVCSDLSTARGLSTGAHSFALLGGDTPVYVDSSNGGAWVLIGRGREDWAWSNAGSGIPADVAMGVGTPAAFAPKYLSSAMIEHLISTTPGSLDLRDLEVRLKRAADLTGSQYQEVRWQFVNDTAWNWDFPVQNQTVQQTIMSSVLGPSITASGGLNDLQPGNDYSRVFTWAWDGHDRKMGFSYGQGVNLGSSLATSFLWQSSNEGHDIPYTEVYLRLPLCGGAACNGHGSCEVVSGAEVCTCDDPYTGPACELTGVVDGTSCLDIHTRLPAAVSGTYGIDPDDAGPLPAFTAFCDMTTDGGGWTRVGYDNFESGTATGWSSGGVESSCTTALTHFLGGTQYFGMNSASERLYDLKQIPHTEARVLLDYLILDSWDGELAIVQVEGSDIYSTTFFAGGNNVCGPGFGDLGAQPVASQSPHTTNDLTVRVTSTLDQNPGDESFGIDNVRVMVR